MSTPEQPKQKTCRICGEDCSNRPRIKDRAGNYYCRDCYEKAKRKKKAAGIPKKAAPRARPRRQPRPPAHEDGLDLLAELAEQESSAPTVERPCTPCESCGAPIPEGVKLCARCGYDRAKGRRAVLATAAAFPGVSSSRGGAGFSLGVPEVVKEPWFAFVVPTVIQGLLLVVAPSLFAVWLSLFSWTMLIVVLVQAFRQSMSQGLLSLCIPCYVFYFALFRMGNPYLTALFFASQLPGTVLLFLIFASLSQG